MAGHRLGGGDSMSAASISLDDLTVTQEKKGDTLVVKVRREKEAGLSSLFGEPEDAAQGAQLRDPFARLVAREQLRVVSGLAQAQAIANGPTLQASCLDCAALGPPRALVAEPGGWLAQAANWLAR